MRQLLYKALYGKRCGLIVTLSLAIVGLYGGYLLWFVCTRYLPAPDSIAWKLAFLFNLTFCAFLALARIPDTLFTNRRLQPILWLPVHSTLLVRLALSGLLCLQAGVIIMIFWAFLWHASHCRGTLLALMLCCLFCAALLDLCILLLSLLFSRILSARSLGYGFILLQYGGCFLTALLSARGLLHLPTLLTVRPLSFLAGIVVLLLLLALCCRIATVRWYVCGYAKIQRFQRQQHLRTATISHIHNPYLLLEWTRVLRNKELIFYTTIKNLVTLALLCALFHQRAYLLLPQPDMLAMLLLSTCCAINTISSTAFSSDESKACYVFLPIAPAQLFLWKTLVATFWGLPPVLLVWGASICALRLSPATALLLLLYALTGTLLCAGLGVWLDRTMPRSPQSTNELLHGNLSKVCVLIATLALTLSLFRIAGAHALAAATMLHATLILCAGTRFLLTKEDCP